MHQENPVLAIAMIGILLIGPAILAVWGLLTRSGRARSDPTPSVVLSKAGAVANSTLLYAIAFNFVFFVQELFLVIPKALTPGLKPTLYHNNHDWIGRDPIARLYQGTGALAILILGLAAILAVRLRLFRSPLAWLALTWIGFQGMMQSLLQFPSGALDAHNDVGEAMIYLAWPESLKTIVSLIALALVPLVGLWTTRQLVALAPDEQRAGNNLTVLYLGTIPMLVGTLLIVPFRVPGGLDRILISPLVVGVIGILWAQAGAWTTRRASEHGASRLSDRLSWQLAAVLVAMLAVFQLVLRRGIPFY